MYMYMQIRFVIVMTFFVVEQWCTLIQCSDATGCHRGPIDLEISVNPLASWQSFPLYNISPPA